MNTILFSKMWKRRLHILTDTALSVGHVGSCCRLFTLFSQKIAATLLLLFCLGIGNIWGDTVTFDATSDSGSGSITKSGITVSMSTMNRTQKDNFRCNSGSDMVVTSTAGNMTKVEITCTGSNTDNYSPSKFSLKSGSAGSYNNGGSGSKVGTWTGNATTFTLTASAQVRITQIVVTYTAAATCSNKVALTKGEENNGSFNCTRKKLRF